MAANEKELPKNPEPPKPDASKSDTVMVDIRNPTRARRVIYDGIADEKGKQRCLTIERNSTKENVLVHRDVVREMAKRNRVRQDSDLIMTPAGSKPAPKVEPDDE